MEKASGGDEAATAAGEGIKEVLEGWPLYRALVLDPAKRGEAGELSLHCTECGGAQRWRPVEAQYPSASTSGLFGYSIYKCKNCGLENAFFAWVVLPDPAAGTVRFMKIGQYPPLEDRPPPGLLLEDDDMDLYKKALRSRNFNFGLGALSYLRRVVENRMSDFLDLIAEAAAASGTAGADLHEQVARVKKSRVFDEKVSFAAGLLPAYLRPGGVNPIDALHGVASEGLHALSEAECIERFDRARAGFEFLFQRLRVEKKQAEEFVKGMKALTARRERRGETREVEAPPKTG